MKRRRFLQTCTGALAAATASGKSASAVEGTGTEPRITGSFFDVIHVNWFDAAYWTDTCLHWKEENWRALIRDMHGIGIDTAICVSAAFWGRPVFGGYEKTVGKPIRYGCEDPLGTCFDEAEKLGMTMFFGFGCRGRVSQVRDYTGMQPPWPEVWFRWNTAVAEALMERFSDSPSFGGLYVSYEIDFHDYQLDLYEKLIKEYLRPAVGDVRLLASPGSLGHHPDIARLPADLERMGLDILAAQDYGGRSNDVEAALKLVRENAAGLEKIRGVLADTGVALWCNCELFAFEGLPDGRGACIAGPIERIKEQIAIQAPLAEKLISYQYQGIMNRHTDLVNIGHPGTDKLYEDYVAYLDERFPGLRRSLATT